VVPALIMFAKHYMGQKIAASLLGIYCCRMISGSCQKPLFASFHLRPFSAGLQSQHSRLLHVEFCLRFETFGIGRFLSCTTFALSAAGYQICSQHLSAHDQSHLPLRFRLHLEMQALH